MSERTCEGCGTALDSEYESQANRKRCDECAVAMPLEAQLAESSASEAALREQWRKSESEWREEAKNSLATIATLREENERLRGVAKEIREAWEFARRWMIPDAPGHAEADVDAALSKKPTR